MLHSALTQYKPSRRMLYASVNNIVMYRMLSIDDWLMHESYSWIYSWILLSSPITGSSGSLHQGLGADSWGMISSPCVSSIMWESCNAPVLCTPPPPKNNKKPGHRVIQTPTYMQKLILVVWHNFRVKCCPTYPQEWVGDAIDRCSEPDRGSQTGGEWGKNRTLVLDPHLFAACMYMDIFLHS